MGVFIYGLTKIVLENISFGTGCFFEHISRLHAAPRDHTYVYVYVCEYPYVEIRFVGSEANENPR